jgi:hypothetical protein
MEVVPTADGEEDGVIWLRCPGCQGYLPKIDSGGLSSRRRPEAASSPPADSRRDAAPAPGGRDGWPGADEAGGAGGLSEADDAGAAGDDGDDGDEDDEDGAASVAAGAAAATAVEEPPLSLDEADLSRAVPYRPWESYEVGTVVHHLAWGDFGVVRAKETLPGRRQAIKVQFEKSGVVRLIEQSREES